MGGALYLQMTGVQYGTQMNCMMCNKDAAFNPHKPKFDHHLILWLSRSILVAGMSDAAALAFTLSAAVIITNKQGKKVWWIPSDGYKLIRTGDEITVLSPYLLKVQQEIKIGTVDQKTHTKDTLAVAHQHTIGASSPCKKSLS